MLFGHSPFKNKGTNRQYNIISYIRNAKYSFPSDIKISNEAKDLIKRLLNPRTKERLGFNGIYEIQEHSFFKSVDWEDVLSRKIEAPIKVKTPKRRNREVGLSVQTTRNY